MANTVVMTLCEGVMTPVHHFCYTIFSATFLENCGRDESLATTVCLITVIWGKQGHATCRIFLLQQSLFFVPVECHGDTKNCYQDEVSMAKLSFGDVARYKAVVSVCQCRYVT